MRSHTDSNQDPSVEKYHLIKDDFCQQRRDEAVFTDDGQKYQIEIPPPFSLDRMSLISYDLIINRLAFVLI